MGKGNSRTFFENMVGEKFPMENAYSVTEKKVYYCPCIVDDFKMAGKKRNIDPMCHDGALHTLLHTRETVKRGSVVVPWIAFRA